MAHDCQSDLDVRDKKFGNAGIHIHRNCHSIGLQLLPRVQKGQRLFPRSLHILLKFIAQLTQRHQRNNAKCFGVSVLQRFGGRHWVEACRQSVVMV
jgi:hypothetical protein